MLQRSNQQTSLPLHLQQQKDMDYQYQHIRYQIINSNYFHRTQKTQRLIIQSWILKLDSLAYDTQMKRNRNHYAKVFNLMCDCEVIIEPFTHLPPKDDLPKMSKQQINSLIDQVQRLVKKQQQSKYNISNQQPPTQQNCDFVINQNTKNNSFKRSLGGGKLVNSRQQSGFIPNTEYFSVLEQSKQSQNSIQKKEYFSEMKNRQNANLSSSNKINESFTFQISNKPIHQPKHLVIKINTKQNNIYHQDSQSCMDIDQCQNQQTSSIINHARLPNQQQNYTLMTQIIDQEHTLNLSTAVEEFVEQCDLDSQLSQRCREKDQVLNHSYFTWKVKENNPPSQSNFKKTKIKLTQGIPSKSLIKSKMNSSSFNLYIKDRSQGEGSISIRSQQSLLSELEYNSSRHSSSSLKDISTSIINSKF